MALKEPIAYGCHSIVYYDIDPQCMTRGDDRHSFIWIHSVLVLVIVSQLFIIMFRLPWKGKIFSDSLIYRTVALIPLDSSTSPVYSLI